MQLIGIEIESLEMNFRRSFVFIKRNVDLLVKDSYIKTRLWRNQPAVER